MLPAGEPMEAHLKAITFGRATLPIDPVARNAAMLSNVHLGPDPDGIYRRVRLFNRFDKAMLPSLGLGTYLAANPQTTLKIETNRLVVGDKAVPIDKEFNTIVYSQGLANLLLINLKHFYLLEIPQCLIIFILNCVKYQI